MNDTGKVMKNWTILEIAVNANAAVGEKPQAFFSHATKYTGK